MKDNLKKKSKYLTMTILFNYHDDESSFKSTSCTRYTEEEIYHVHLSLCTFKKNKSSLKGNASLPLKVEGRIRGIPQYQVTYVRAEV